MKRTDQDGRPAPKPRIVLDGGMRTDAALKVILRRLLQAARDNLDGTRRDLDPEFLHDFRVAVRRTRSCLSQIKKVFTAAEIEPFRREFSWLGEITGPKRDLDVFLIAMQGYRSELDETAWNVLNPLIVFVRHRQDEERERLSALLGSARCNRLFEDWQRFLKRPDAQAVGGKNAGRPIAEVASRRIARAFARALAKGRGIGPRTKASKLHRLRIECKKLRYLLEFFRSLYDPRDLGPPLKSLKRLQDCLGDFNDLEFQQGFLRQSAGRMGEEEALPAELSREIARLVERLASRQEKQRRLFADRFAGFDSPATHRRLERMTAAPAGGDGKVGPGAGSTGGRPEPPE